MRRQSEKQPDRRDGQDFDSGEYIESIRCFWRLCGLSRFGLNLGFRLVPRGCFPPTLLLLLLFHMVGLRGLTINHTPASRGGERNSELGDDFHLDGDRRRQGAHCHSRARAQNLSEILGIDLVVAGEITVHVNEEGQAVDDILKRGADVF